MVEHHLPAACKLWKLGTGDSIDVAVYAHGGLTDEEAAAKTARIWIPLLYSNRIFPVFLMWETGARKTIANMFEDVTRGEAELAGGPRWERFKQRFDRSEEHTSELQSLMRISYAVFCLKKKNTHENTKTNSH